MRSAIPDSESLSLEELDNKIAWEAISSTYYWATPLKTVSIGGVDIPLTVDHVIFDSGSSLNYIPSKEYLFVVASIMKDHEC